MTYVNSGGQEYIDVSINPQLVNRLEKKRLQLPNPTVMVITCVDSFVPQAYGGPHSITIRATLNDGVTSRRSDLADVILLGGGAIIPVSKLRHASEVDVTPRGKPFGTYTVPSPFNGRGDYYNTLGFDVGPGNTSVPSDFVVDLHDVGEKTLAIKFEAFQEFSYDPLAVFPRDTIYFENLNIEIRFLYSFDLRYQPVMNNYRSSSDPTNPFNPQGSIAMLHSVPDPGNNAYPARGSPVLVTRSWSVPRSNPGVFSTYGSIIYNGKTKTVSFAAA